MKLGKKHARIFNVGLASIVGIQSAASAGFSWNDLATNSMSNISPAGSYTVRDSSGNVQETYFYTTSIYYRFGPAFSYPDPIVVFSPPQVSYGCGGLSIKGMFIKILGLDRLELMLKNAGASVAWGIAIGLIYSLPGVASSFSFINNWAKKIQQLLGNACESGKRIGQLLQNKVPGLESDGAVRKAISFVDEKVKWLDNQAQATLSLFNLDGLFDDDGIIKVDDFGISENTKVEAYRDAIVNTMVIPSIKGNVLSELLSAMSSQKKMDFIKTIFGQDVNSIKNFSSAIVEIVYNNASNTITTNTVNVNGVSQSIKVMPIGAIISNFLNDASVNKQFAMANDLSSVGFSMAIAPDFGAAQSTDISNAVKMVAKVLDGSASDTTKARMHEIIKGNEALIKTTKQVPPTTVQEFTLAFIHYMMFGWQDGGGGVQSLKKPKAMRFVVVALPSERANSSDMKHFIFIPSNDAVTDFFDLNSNTPQGIYYKSEDAIKRMVQGESIASIMNEANSPMILIPGLVDKIRIIQESPKAKRASLIELLVKYNTYNVISQAISRMLEFGGGVRGSYPVLAWTGSQWGAPSKISPNPKLRSDFLAATASYSREVNNFYIEAQNILKDFLGNTFGTTSPDKLNYIFLQQDKENRARTVKVLP